jgi:hypothetical protein
MTVSQSNYISYNQAMRETACSTPRRSMKGIAVPTAPITSSMRGIHVKDNGFNKAKKDSQFLMDGR